MVHNTLVTVIKQKLNLMEDLKMKFKRILAPVALSLVVAFGATACSGGDDTTTPDNATEDTAGDDAAADGAEDAGDAADGAEDAGDLTVDDGAGAEDAGNAEESTDAQ